MSDRIPQTYLVKLVGIGDKIESIQLFIGIFCVVSFFTFVAMDVFARTIMKPIIWAQEVAMFSYIWAIFMGSGIAVRKNTHFKIDMLTNLLPSFKFLFNIMNSVLALIFVYLMIGPGLDFALMGIKRVSNPSRIPLIVPTIAIPICGLFFLFFLVENMVCALFHWEVRDIKNYINKSGGEGK